MYNRRYIGIENELLSYDSTGERNSFITYFGLLKSHVGKNNFYEISNTSIRTNTGNGFYVDGEEIEILTPPIAINKGFASRLTDSLMIGREVVVNSTEKFGLSHTGYSMHWNLSKSDSITKDCMYEALAIPIQLFTTNPLSQGFNVRSKTNRIEMLGDSVSNENQIRAAALFFGAAQCAIEENGGCPFNLEKSFRIGNSQKVFIPNGRYDFIKSSDFNNDLKEVQVQEFMESFFHWIKPYLNELGTKQEIKNLKMFIEGDKDLEFDQFKNYAHILDNNGYEKGAFSPILDYCGNPIDRILKPDTNKNRKIPLEGKLLGAIASSPNIKCMYWDTVRIGLRRVVVTNGIDNIYRLGPSIDKTLPRFCPPYHKKDNEKLLKKPFKLADNKNKIFYQPDKDTSGIFRSTIIDRTLGYLNNIKFQVLKSTSELLMGSAIAVGGVFVGVNFVEELYFDGKAREYIVEKVEKNKKINVDELEIKKNKKSTEERK